MHKLRVNFTNQAKRQGQRSQSIQTIFQRHDIVAHFTKISRTPCHGRACFHGKEFTQGRGVDAIFDMVGGDYIPRELDLLARDGRLCFVALMAGAKVEADFGAIQRKHLTVTGSTLRGRPVEQKAQIVAALKEKVWRLWGQGTLRTCTYKTFPLAEASQAHALMESSQHIGKIILVN